jgi:Lon protease-like protein
MNAQMDTVSIFPLSSVLFPEGLMSLRIFEPRYLEMVSQCLKADTPFGVCLIEQGSEVGDAAVSFQVGTLAEIVNWDQSEDGVLLIDVIGVERFKIHESEVHANQSITATIELLPEGNKRPVPKQLGNLTQMLEGFLKKYQDDIPFDQQQLDDAAWVGYRLAEVLPMESIMQQRLLEINDPVERLNVLVGLFADK